MNTRAIVAAGELTERIAIEQRTSTVDALGQAIETWSTVATVWAKPEPLAGREFFAAGQTQAAAQIRFTLRHRAGITDAMRVIWRAEPYAIVAPPIDVAGARQALELMCVKGPTP